MNVLEPVPMDSGESPPQWNPPVTLIPVKGKIEFHASLTKTINGSTTEKKYTTARSILPELTQLDRREKDKDAVLERIRVVIVLNGNAFAYSQSGSPRDLATALEEAIPQNIQAEEIFAKLEYLNPSLADHPPLSLSQDESDRIRMEVQKIHAATNRLLQTQLMLAGRSCRRTRLTSSSSCSSRNARKSRGFPNAIRCRNFATGCPRLERKVPEISKTTKAIRNTSRSKPRAENSSNALRWRSTREL